MGRDSQLSNALRITDVNDFLGPSTNCILPLNGGATFDVKQNDMNVVQKAPAGSVLTPIIPIKATSSNSTKAKVTVSDCLSCSGCVTSAETVLLSTESKDSFKSIMKRARHGDQTSYNVVALSQQSVASIAAQEGLSLTTTAQKLATFLQQEAGFDAVLDLSEMRQISLLRASEEFVLRYKSGRTLTITSACPGWLTYAEKTQSQAVLDCISSIRSPQGMLGSFAERLSLDKGKKTMSVSAVMPCHDKKIEAARPEFATVNNGTDSERELNCVITTEELMDIISESDFSIQEAHESNLTYLFGPRDDNRFGEKVGSESGGYADFILRAASREILNKELENGPLITKKSSKSGDIKSVTISNIDGSKKLCFATAYGFRSLQSVIRKVKRGESPYNYIELMACPGGCTNGGGQISLPEEVISDPGALKQKTKEHLMRVNEAYFDAPEIHDSTLSSHIEGLLDGQSASREGTAKMKERFNIQIQSRKESSGMASLSW